MTTEASPKSGIRALKSGEILFNEGDVAASLFIIQKGQVRLFKPKGKGFVELAVLRAGEVIGEMAYFDEDGSGRKRSCSASAITPVEVVEISFTAFGKTMQSLNPWFKTIINTLVSRLKKTNSRVRELEDNQALSYGSKASTYEFMKPIEVMRILGTLFLVFRAHGEMRENAALAVHRRALTLYTAEMYQIMDSKLESVLNILTELGWLEVREDDDKLPFVYLLKNIDLVRQLFIFYNTERHLPDEKKMRISERCETVLGKMLELKASNPVFDIPNLRVIDDVPPKFTKYYRLTPVIEELKKLNVQVTPTMLEDARGAGIVGEVVSLEGQFVVEIDLPKLERTWPIIRFMNTMRKLNEKSA
jgi:CRP-like cAMP-binding protein